jgi:hypothetical protein
MPTPSPPPEVEITVSSQPEGATVFDGNGARLGETPWTHRYARSPDELSFQLRLKGYRDGELTVKLDRDAQRTAVLEKIVRRHAPAVAAPPRPEKRPSKNGYLDPFAR